MNEINNNLCIQYLLKKKKKKKRACFDFLLLRHTN